MHKHLKNELREQKLLVSGNKSQLFERLIESNRSKNNDEDDTVLTRNSKDTDNSDTSGCGKTDEDQSEVEG